MQPKADPRPSLGTTIPLMYFCLYCNRWKDASVMEIETNLRSAAYGQWVCSSEAQGPYPDDNYHTYPDDYARPFLNSP